MARKLEAIISISTATARRGVADLNQKMRGLGDSTAKTSTATGRLAASARNMVASFVGIAGIIKLFAAVRAEMEAVERTTKSVLQGMRALQALSTMKGFRRAEQEFVFNQATKLGGAQAIERTAQAYYTLKGGTYGMAPERQRGLFKESVAFAKTDPTADLNQVVNLFTTMASQQKGMTPLAISNLLSQGIEAAKSTTGEMAQFLPGVMTTAKVGKVDPAMAMAMFAMATRQAGGVSKSGLAVSRVMMNLLVPKGGIEQDMRRYGYPVKGNLTEKLEWLRDRGGEMPEALQAKLGGVRGIQALATIVSDPVGLAREEAQMRAAVRDPTSLVGRRMKEMFGEMPGQIVLEQQQQMEAMLERAQVDPAELQRANQILLQDLIMRRKGFDPARRKLAKAESDMLRLFGKRINRPDAPVSEIALTELLREGWTPEQLMGVGFEAAGQLRDETYFATAGREAKAIRRAKAAIRERLKAAGLSPLGDGQIESPEAGQWSQQVDNRQIEIELGVGVGATLRNLVNIGTYYGTRPKPREQNKETRSKMPPSEGER